jgi:hypothetical protein
MPYNFFEVQKRMVLYGAILAGQEVLFADCFPPHSFLQLPGQDLFFLLEPLQGFTGLNVQMAG